MKERRNILVFGGASSGKSEYAEEICQTLGGPKVYVATAQAFDGEMSEKIARHQSQRGTGWQTFEEPLTPYNILLNRNAGEIVLVDCATIWLSNILLAEKDMVAECDRLLHAIDTCPANIVTVSNEVGTGIVPDTKLGRVFRDMQGKLNQRLAHQADCVIQVIVGLPQVLKGTPP